MATKVKIFVPTNDGDWHGMSAERLWATKVGHGEYRLDNNPLYAYDLSFGDVVAASPMEPGLLKFDKLVRKGGHSNYRVLLKAGVPRKEFERLWSDIEKLGCGYESSRDPEDVFAIDVPASSDVNAVYRVLEKGVQEGVWHLDEGNFEHPKP